MVRHIPSLSSLQKREGSSCRHSRGQHSFMAARRPTSEKVAQDTAVQCLAVCTHAAGTCFTVAALAPRRHGEGTGTGGDLHMPPASNGALSGWDGEDCGLSGVAQDEDGAGSAKRRLPCIALVMSEIAGPLLRSWMHGPAASPRRAGFQISCGRCVRARGNYYIHAARGVI
jgi:hypothetical protein